MPAAAARRGGEPVERVGDPRQGRLETVQGLVGVDDADAVRREEVKQRSGPALDDRPIVGPEELGEAAHF